MLTTHINTLYSLTLYSALSTFRQLVNASLMYPNGPMKNGNHGRV